MYKNFFGLRANPFNVNPDPRFLYLTRHAREALTSLAYGILNRKGFILLTGEVGTGKTTLLNQVLDLLSRRHVASAFVFNSQLNATELFDLMMADFGIACESGQKSQVLLRLHRWLVERYRAGENTVLIVDEAQNLSSPVLEEIRLLTNLETPTTKLLQIVLSGQPELEEKLRQPQLRQLRQRVTLRCRLYPLDLEETGGYIAQRLRIAGRNGQPIFTPEAIERTYTYSLGIPRVINLLCEHALISAFVDNEKTVSASKVEEVAHELELDQIRPVSSPPEGNGESLNPAKAQRNLADLAERLRRPD